VDEKEKRRCNNMTAKRKIEIFSAGCSICNEVVEMVKKTACASCEVSVLDMHKPEVSERAKKLGIKSLPAVVIDGELADCCRGRGPDLETLKACGLGKPL
jgi:plasmid rolling circle replication initiator protein Rep